MTFSEILRKIDNTIDASRKIYEQEKDALHRARSSEDKEPIHFSSAQKITTQCLTCKGEVVLYQITSSWGEKYEEGMVTIEWTCRKKGKQLFEGKRSSVVDKLVQLSE